MKDVLKIASGAALGIAAFQFVVGPAVQYVIIAILRAVLS